MLNIFKNILGLLFLPLIPHRAKDLIITRTGPSDFPHDLPYHAGSATVVVHQDGVLV